MGRKRKSKSSHYGPTDTAAESATSEAQLAPDSLAMDVSPSLLPPLPEIHVASIKLVSDAPITTSSTHTTALTTTSAITVSSSTAFRNDTGPTTTAAADDTEEWQTVKKSKKQKQPKGTQNYPEFCVSPQKLKRQIGVSDLQGLVLWLMADGAAPQWLLTRHKPLIRRMVVMMVPGFTPNMFDGTLFGGQGLVSDDPEGADYFPSTLDRRKLPDCVADMADMFPHVWPVKAAGDERHNRLHSPLNSFLQAPIPKGQDPASRAGTSRLKVTELLMTVDEMIENDYVLHSSQIQQRRQELQLPETDEERASVEKRRLDGWVETDLSKRNGKENEAGSQTEGKTIYCIDCEMCKTGEKDFELTRLSIVDWDGKVVYDQLVKPTKPIIDYVTAYSGITEAMLADVTTTLADVQKELLSLFDADTILVGQSLNSDLDALRFAHPHIIDTSVIYHHARGPPYKASLKTLTQRFLRREIQNAGHEIGHDSIEDAKACLDLLKLKLEKGKAFGTADEMKETIFKRIHRPGNGPLKKTAMVDTGDPRKWFGAAATSPISCRDDDEIVAVMKRCINGDEARALPAHDFVWGRLRSLESARNYSEPESERGGKMDLNVPLPDVRTDPPAHVLAAKVEETVKRVKEVYDSLPPCSAFVVMSGIGDPRAWKRLDMMQKRFKEEYKVKKWDELSVQWSDAEEVMLKKELKRARAGVGFLVVK